MRFCLRSERLQTTGKRNNVQACTFCTLPIQSRRALMLGVALVHEHCDKEHILIGMQIHIQ